MVDLLGRFLFISELVSLCSVLSRGGPRLLIITPGCPGLNRSIYHLTCGQWLIDWFDWSWWQFPMQPSGMTWACIIISLTWSYIQIPIFLNAVLQKIFEPVCTNAFIKQCELERDNMHIIVNCVCEKKLQLWPTLMKKYIVSYILHEVHPIIYV